jgi:Na+-driven multidrug efflux pump
MKASLWLTIVALLLVAIGLGMQLYVWALPYFALIAALMFFARWVAYWEGRRNND